MEDEDFEIDYEVSDDEDELEEYEFGSEDDEYEYTDDDFEEPQPMLDFVNSVHNDELRDAGNSFHSMLGDKIKDAIEAERINIGTQMFGSEMAEE
jgi:hypothetical protein